MRLLMSILALLGVLGVCGDARGQAPEQDQKQSQSAKQAQGTGQVIAPPPAQPPIAAPAGTFSIDGIAVRIEDDVILESEVRELASFQQLVDGSPKPRSEVIQELTDQWIVRGEAKTALFPDPSTADVDRAYADFVKQFASPEDFKARYAKAGLTEAAVRRMVTQQLYLSRFLDYRFRPTAQVTREQIEAYYQNEFAAKLKAANQEVPALDEVADTIREILIQRSINDNSAKWLDDTRAHLRIDIVQEGKAS
jgi:hypothetical protein